MLSFIYFFLISWKYKKNQLPEKLRMGQWLNLDDLYVLQIVVIKWYFWLKCNENESQYLPNYLSLWNSVYTTCWKLVQKVKRQNKYQKAKTLHLQSYLPMHFPILPTCIPGQGLFDFTIEMKRVHNPGMAAAQWMNLRHQRRILHNSQSNAPKIRL